MLFGRRALCQDIFIIQKLLICTDSAVVKSFIVIKVAKKQMFFLSNKVMDGELGRGRGRRKGGRGGEGGGKGTGDRTLFKGEGRLKRNKRRLLPGNSTIIYQHKSNYLML